VTAAPEQLVIIKPQEHHGETAIKVSRACRATGLSPRPYGRSSIVLSLPIDADAVGTQMETADAAV
jgi:hypothetical protein